jgi:hypothetical protein
MSTMLYGNPIEGHTVPKLHIGTGGLKG